MIIPFTENDRLIDTRGIHWVRREERDRWRRRAYLALALFAASQAWALWLAFR